MALIPYVFVIVLAFLMAGAEGVKEATRGEHGTGLSRGGPVLILVLGTATVAILSSGWLVTLLPTLLPWIASLFLCPDKVRGWESHLVWADVSKQAAEGEQSNMPLLREVAWVILYCGWPRERKHARRFLLDEEVQPIANGVPKSDDFWSFKTAQTVAVPVLLVAGCFGGQFLYLQYFGEVVIAEVTEFDDDGVRYSFEVNGNSYSHSDVTGRKNLLAGLYPSDYDAAKKSGVVKVSYMTTNPWVNYPVGDGWRAKSIPLCSAAFFVGIELFIIVGMVASYVGFLNEEVKGCTRRGI